MKSCVSENKIFTVVKLATRTESYGEDKDCTSKVLFRHCSQSLPHVKHKRD